MGRQCLIAGCAAAGLLLGALAVFSQNAPGTGTVAMKVFARTAQGELSAEMPDDARWCQPDITFTIRGQEDTFFKEDRTLLQKLLGGVRVGLERECPQVRSITFNGFVDDVFIYRGHASRDNPQGQWVLFTLPVALVQSPEPPPPPQAAATAPPPPAARRESIAECDTLAAHPDDPLKPKTVAGVRDDDIQPGPALKACTEAVEVEPDNTRLKFQLARSLISYDKADEGLELLIESAEEGHAIAVAALGDITLYGLLDEKPDPEIAKQLYQKSAQLGFRPAAALAAAIEANPQEDTSQQTAAEPEYHHPNRLEIVLRGEVLPGSGGAFFDTVSYSTQVVAGIKHHCPDKGGDLAPGKAFAVIYQRVGLQALMFVNEAANEKLQQEGMDDGYALAMTAGCDSPKVQAAINSVQRTLQ